MLNKIAKTYLRAIEIIGMVLLVMIFALLMIQVICRVANIGQSFTEELSRYCFCIMVFLGTTLTLVEGVDIAVDMVVSRLPQAAQRAAAVIAYGMTALFAAFSVYSIGVFNGSNASATALSMQWLKMTWIYNLIRVAFAIMFVEAVILLLRAALGKSTVYNIHADEKAEEKKMEIDI